MNVGFAGTPPFAAVVLNALLGAGFTVPFVLTRPDRPRGRGLKSEPSAVKRLALERGVAVLQPATLLDEAARATLLAVPIDVLAVAAYGLILPPAVLAWPRHGCLNVHASLLPRWRGAAPVQRALLAGDEETGATIMQMDAGLDTGPILDAVRIPIGPRDTTATLLDRVAGEGAHALVGVLRRLAAGKPIPEAPQPAAGVSYAAKIAKAEAAIDWRNTARVIDRQVRAFDPVPGANTMLSGETVKIWAAEISGAPPAGGPPGTLLAVGRGDIVVACGDGALRIVELQPAGGRRMSAAAFAAGRRLAPGARFGGPEA
jgi:methionyl-tRNA formyltransferase